MEQNQAYDVVIVGAGLSGLSAAIWLQKAGLSVVVLEKNDRPGGKLLTEEVQGFKLDLGFQVLLTAYPEAKRILNYNHLDLRKFRPGSVLLQNGRKEYMFDPFREPLKLFSMIAFSKASFGDKLRLFQMRQRLKSMNYDSILGQFEVKSSTILTKRKFSKTFIRSFFKPFYSGIFLEPELRTSRRMLDFVFKMMAEGSVSIPANGIEEIPKQLAKRLGPDVVLCSKKVLSVNEHQVQTDSGEVYNAHSVIVATEAGTELHKDIGCADDIKYHGTTVVYFSSKLGLEHGSMLRLLNDKDALTNHYAELSSIAPELAPQGQHLISVSIIGVPELEDEAIFEKIKSELSVYETTNEWKPLKIYRIPRALPSQESVLGQVKSGRYTCKNGLYFCGDYHLYGSQNAAFKMGRDVAEHIIAQFKAAGKMKGKNKRKI